jgi:hypothetical protein
LKENIASIECIDLLQLLLRVMGRAARCSPGWRGKLDYRMNAGLMLDP